ncbi:hypothetical protein RB597_005760 [Gaeumannomyces tritici]
MDYSQATYFPGAQPYQFIGMPPLTPSHSTSGPSEDFNTTSPPDVYSEYPNDQYAANFDGYPSGFSHGLPDQQHHQPAPGGGVFPVAGPPTPPNNNALHASHAHAAQVLNGGAVPPQHQAAAPGGVLPKEELLDEQLANSRRGGSQSGEEGDKLTPTQHKRKAQNRAAQRAFRERKERHVKDLEAKLASLEAAQQQATTENERLKRDLQKISTENEILRATSSLSGAGSPNGSSGRGGGGGSSGGGNDSTSTAQLTTGPMTYNPTDFYSDLLAGHDNKTLNHRIVLSDSGERLYDASATWEYIINHDLFKANRLDIADISNRLKGRAKCDGQGPVFEEGAIRDALEQSMASGSDSLL